MVWPISISWKVWLWHIQIEKYGRGSGPHSCQWLNFEVLFQLATPKVVSLYIVEFSFISFWFHSFSFDSLLNFFPFDRFAIAFWLCCFSFLVSCLWFCCSLLQFIHKSLYFLIYSLQLMSFVLNAFTIVVLKDLSCSCWGHENSL